jgi:hypothetical protein
MILRTKGKPINIETHLVGKVTRDPNQLDENTFLLADGEVKDLPQKNFIGVLSKQEKIRQPKNSQRAANAGHSGIGTVSGKADERKRN